MGQVVDAGGSPVSGAVVATGGRRVVTNATGRFLFLDLPKGNYTISATKGGYLAGAPGRMRPNGPSTPIELAEGERVGNLRIALWRHASISGTLYDDLGEPLTGVPIWSLIRTYGNGRVRWADGPSGTTDDRGIYRISRMAPGDYALCVVAAQSTMPTSLVEGLAGARVAGTTSEFQRPYQMPSIGFDARVPTAGIRMGEWVLHTAGPFAGGLVPPTPGDDGVIYSFQSTCYPSAIGLANAEVVTVAAGQERLGADIRLKLSRGVTVAGTVVGPDGPVPHVGVRLAADFAPDLNAEQTWEAALTVSDARGRFTLLGVPPGSYTLRALKVPPRAYSAPAPPAPDAPPPPPGPPPLPAEPTYWANLPLTVGPNGFANLTVPLHNGIRISGRIRFEGTAKRPQPGAFNEVGVSLEPADGHRIGYPLEMRVDHDWTFSSFEIPPGKYILQANISGWTTKAATLSGIDVSAAPFDLQQGASDITVVVTDKPTELTGTVRDDRGAADPSAGVVAVSLEREAWTSYGMSPRRLRYVRPNRYGVYRIGGLPPGQYFVAAVDDASVANWQNPATLEAIARQAERIVLADGDKKSLDLVTRSLR
jgi:hypothetical protein